MKKVLVFGGSGFLGHYLVEELLKRNYSVSVADIKENTEFSEMATFHLCDISKKADIEKVFSSQSFDIVYNLAGFASLDDSINHPVKTMELNVLSNMHIINASIKNNVSNYVYASSAYAMSNKGSFYGISKLAAEKIIEEYHKKFDLPFIILRYGSVYSEKPFSNNYVYNVVKSALKSNKIEHGGDGEEIREYIHASDAAKLSVDVIESEEFKNLHVILTGTERMKRSELFNMINEIMNDKLEISYGKSGYDNHYKFTPYSFEPSVSKKLIANPHIDMGQGLLECIRAAHNQK